MWRSIVPSALSVLFSLNLLIQGDARTRRFVGVVYAVLGAFVALAWWAQGHQEHPFARALLRSRGPQTDGPITTTAEGYKAAWSFLRFGAAALALTLLTGYALVSAQSSRLQTILLVLLPFTLLPAGMGLFGGVYLLVRARLRP